jgi:DNA-binding CsgD family transcriptional regulator
MLKGLTYDGIAADLGLSAATVKTYRDRAFDRLGINHRNQLFGLLASR